MYKSPKCHKCNSMLFQNGETFFKIILIFSHLILEIFLQGFHIQKHISLDLAGLKVQDNCSSALSFQKNKYHYNQKCF